MSEFPPLPKPLTLYPDPRVAAREAEGPSVVMFPPTIAQGLVVLGWDEDGKEISLCEVRIDPELLRRIVRLTANGEEVLAGLRAYLKERGHV